MKTPTSERSRHAVAYLVSPAVAVLAVATLLDPFGIAPGDPSSLSATSSDLRDQDGDGLVYRQERILETTPTAEDSDLDGFGDSEELARKTSPLNALVHPEGNAIEVGMTARGERDGLHALVAVYVPDSDYQGLDVKIGLLVGRRMFFLRPSMILRSARCAGTSDAPRWPRGFAAGSRCRRRRLCRARSTRATRRRRSASRREPRRSR